MENGTDNNKAKENKKSRINQAVNIILTALMISLAAFAAFIMVNAARGRAVSVFGKSILNVVTGSMEPTLHEGDYIITKKVSPESLKKNDIISFYSRQEDIKGRLVTHRIIEACDDGSFITKGDANEIADTVPVRAEDIVGKYTGRARVFEIISSFADLKKLIMLFVIIPLALVSLYEVKTLAKLFVESKVEEKLSSQEEREKLIRQEIEKQKQLLYKQAEENKEEVKSDEPRGDNEA